MANRTLSLTRALTIALALALTFALGSTIATASGRGQPAVDTGDTIVSGCVIRFSDPDGSPSIHANAAHLCAGITDVRIDRHGDLEVIQSVTGATQNPILFAQCQTDETLGGRGIICGASGGTDSTRFSFYDTRIDRELDLTRRADRMRMQGSNSNVWLGFFHVPGGTR